MELDDEAESDVILYYVVLKVYNERWSIDEFKHGLALKMWNTFYSKKKIH